MFVDNRGGDGCCGGGGGDGLECDNRKRMPRLQWLKETRRGRRLCFKIKNFYLKNNFI